MLHIRDILVVVTRVPSRAIESTTGAAFGDADAVESLSSAGRERKVVSLSRKSMQTIKSKLRTRTSAIN